MFEFLKPLFRSGAKATAKAAAKAEAKEVAGSIVTAAEKATVKGAVVSEATREAAREVTTEAAETAAAAELKAAERTAAAELKAAERTAAAELKAAEKAKAAEVKATDKLAKEYRKANKIGKAEEKEWKVRARTEDPKIVRAELIKEIGGRVPVKPRIGVVKATVLGAGAATGVGGVYEVATHPAVVWGGATTIWLKFWHGKDAVKAAEFGVQPIPNVTDAAGNAIYGLYGKNQETGNRELIHQGTKEECEKVQKELSEHLTGVVQSVAFHAKDAIIKYPGWTIALGAAIIIGQLTGIAAFSKAIEFLTRKVFGEDAGKVGEVIGKLGAYPIGVGMIVSAGALLLKQESPLNNFVDMISPNPTLPPNAAKAFAKLNSRANESVTLEVAQQAPAPQEQDTTPVRKFRPTIASTTDTEQAQAMTRAAGPPVSPPRVKPADGVEQIQGQVVGSN